jgi:hypothetical protein
LRSCEALYTRVSTTALARSISRLAAARPVSARLR